GFAWFGIVAGAVVTGAPGTRSWQVATARFAGGVDLVAPVTGVDLVTGRAPAPPPAGREPPQPRARRGVRAVPAHRTTRARGVDLVTGRAPAPPPAGREPLQRLELRGVSAVHDDGTIGVLGVDLEIRRGELVLLLGQVGSGKSSLLSALAGLVEHTGEVRWNGSDVEDAQAFLRPAQVAHVAQVPRVLSGTFA